MTALQTRQVYMLRKCAIKKGVRKIGTVNVIMKDRSDKDREVIMAIYSPS
jgi:hypothetical protein